MNTSELVRKKFISFFQSKNHKLYRPSSLIPKEEDSTLFTIAGMKQFIDIFLEKKSIEDKRIITIQPCLRVGGKQNDIDNIGKTSRHNTFFEMLGNFSFDDYGKKEAIELAYQFLIEELNLKKEYLFYTVHFQDEESFNIAETIVGKKVIKIKSNDNFWQAGNTGPCGYSFEIYYNIKENNISPEEAKQLIETEDKSLLEIWNLVFIEYNLQEGKKIPLEKKYIDCGAGLERLCSVVDKTFDNFETDLLKPVLKVAEKYCDNLLNTKITSDFIKSISFLVCEGLKPGPIGRAYVLRKLIREVVQICSNPKEVISETVNNMKKYYSFLNKEEIEKVFEEENKIFKKEVLDKIPNLPQNLNEEQAVNLYQTHGIPIKLLKNIFKNLQEEKIKKLQEEHSKKSKAIDIPYNIPTIYNFEEERTNSTVNFLWQDNCSVYKITEGEFVMITGESNFYPRGGGQEGDQGIFRGKQGTGTIKNTLRKKITQKEFIILHYCELTEGILEINEEVTLEINLDLRLGRTRAHSATHIGFESLLRKGFDQNGSFVDDDYLRIDLITEGKEIDIEEINIKTNENIIKNIPSKIYEEKSENIKDINFVKSNYGEIIRIVDFKDISKQPCGGTHVKRTGDIGLFIITKVSSIGKGNKRIEALTGKKAVQYLLELQKKEGKKNTNSNTKKDNKFILNDKFTIEKKNDITIGIIEGKSNNKNAIKVLNKIESKKIAVIFEQELGKGILLKGFEENKINLFKDLGFIGGGKEIKILFSKNKLTVEEIISKL